MGASDDSSDTGPAIGPAIRPERPPDTLRASVDLASRAAPLQVGDFEIDDDGRLRPRADGAPLAFGFSYRGADFIARVQSTPEARVSMSAELGALPFSAEVRGQRRLARLIVEATERLPHGRIRLGEDHGMHLSAEAPAPSPLTPAGVMAALTVLLLDFKPYLDLLRPVVNASPAPAAGD